MSNDWKNADWKYADWKYADVGGAIETVGILEGEITKLTKSYKSAKSDYERNVANAKLQALEQRKKKLELLESQKAKLASLQTAKKTSSKKLYIIGGISAVAVITGLVVYFKFRK